MKKFLLSMVLVSFALVNTWAVEVTIVMNSVSRTMALTEKEGGMNISIGEPVSYKYTFDVSPGIYILEGFDMDGASDGTIELEINGEESQEIKITTISAVATNSDWVLGADYTMDCQASSREGNLRKTTSVSGKEFSAYGINYIGERFLMHVGDSYRILYTMSEDRVEEGYIASFNNSGTVTGASTTAATSIPTCVNYHITVPEGASLYVGAKWGAIYESSGGTHYVPFMEINPISSFTEGGKTTYLFSLGQSCVYNYRVSKPGKLTNAGKFIMTQTIAPMEITAEMMDLESPKYINHNVADYSGANVADILMNINAEGYLKLKSGETHQMVTLRSWQLTDNSTNNYFIEPDYHYTIIGLDGQPSNDVIEIDDNGIIRTKGKGAAIVQVTYDAINLQIYNTSSTEAPASFYYGSLWSAIWPENTGTFVVTVDELEDNLIKRNMNIQEELREDGKSVAVDTEHDVFYYFEEEEGYYYTFTPEGVVSVSVANPIIDTNISKYSGFRDVAANSDGSYTALLTFGRNIIKLTSASGASEYQVISAKPVSYEISNITNPGERIQPGDQLQVQFSGFFHPANKLAGIYNMSGYVVYNGIPNGTSLILGPGQYTFAGNPAAQQVNIEIPEDWEPGKTFDLKNGALQINGFGSVIGKHRDISIATGINPNFTAVVHADYYGSIPDVSIPVHEVDYYQVNFTGLPENATLIVYDRNKEIVNEVEDGKYSLPYGSYTYVVKCTGYGVERTVLSISSQSPKVQTIEIDLQEIDDTGWDGESFIQPEIVSEEESETEGGQFEGMEGFYKITSGYELAWFADQVNAGENNISAILLNSIDLCGYDWTRIGNNTAAYQYKGTFNGAGYTINRLFIDATTTYQALFGYINGAVIKNLTVNGSVENTNNYVAGIIAYSSGTSIIENCHNHVSVSGKQYVGGILAYSANAAIQILNSSNSAEIIASSSGVGGVLGHLLTGTGAVMDKVVNTGAITGASSYVGGLVGNAGNLTITNSYNTGNITNNSTFIGGITGSMNQSASITNAFNTGIISSPTNILYKGGISGASYGTLTNVYTSGDVYRDTEPLKTEEEFASGEVAWLLGDEFGQDIGTDAIPVFAGKRVYQAGYAHNLSLEKDAVYTNKTLPVIEKEGYRTEWYDVPYGNIITEISEDSFIYLLYIRLDEEDPSEPEDLSAVASETSIALSWTASTDNVAVTGYNIYLNDAFETIVKETNHILTRLVPGTSYKIDVEAFDEAGNKSEKATIHVETLLFSSIDNPEGRAIQIYPNPVQNLLNIKVSEKTIDSIFISDSTGKYIYTDFSGKAEVSILVSDWAKGVYFVIIQTDKTTRTYKVIKD